MLRFTYESGKLEYFVDKSLILRRIDVILILLVYFSILFQVLKMLTEKH